MSDPLARLREGDLTAVTFFTGAGISTGAGLATYRGPAGLYTTGGMPPMHAEDAVADRLPVLWAHFRDRVLVTGDLAPTTAHRAITQYAVAHPDVAVRVVTQNIDGLHARATPADSVAEIHGSLTVVRCLDHAHREPFDPASLDADGVPRCTQCGGPCRPDVVLFGEALPWEARRRARDWLYEADVIVAVGTSALVEPAAGMLRYELTNGTPVVWVNPEPAPWPGTHHAAGSADEVLPRLLGVG